MKTFTTSLTPSYNRRGFVTPADKDQYAKATVFTRIANLSTRSETWYAEKRPGYAVSGDNVATGNAGTACHISTRFNGGLPTKIMAFGATSTVYVRTISTAVNWGVTSGAVRHFTEISLNGVNIVLAVCDDQTGWFLAEDTDDPGATFTGDTHTNTTVDNIASTTGFYVGQLVTGSGIAAGTRIAQINSATAITLTAATSSSLSATTITRAYIAKIIDADFPTNIVGRFVELDGTVYIGTRTGRVYGSDLNSVVNWTSTNFVTADSMSDVGTGVMKYRNLIAVFGEESLEFYRNAGNPTGSLLSRVGEVISTVGSSSFFPAFINTGYRSALTASTQDQLFFIGDDAGLWVLDGFNPKKISPIGLTFKMGTSAYKYLFAYQMDDKTFVHIGNATASSDFCLNVETGTFTQPLFSVVPIFGEETSSPPVATSSLLFFVPGDTSGNLYAVNFSTPVFTDATVAYTQSVQIGTDMGTNRRKFVAELRVEADIQTSGTLTVSYSDDGGANYVTVGTITLSDTEQHMRLSGLGSFEGQRLWKFDHSADTANRIKQIEIDYEVAT